MGSAGLLVDSQKMRLSLFLESSTEPLAHQSPPRREPNSTGFRSTESYRGCGLLAASAGHTRIVGQGAAVSTERRRTVLP